MCWNDYCKKSQCDGLNHGDDISPWFEKPGAVAERTAHLYMRYMHKLLQQASETVVFTDYVRKNAYDSAYRAGLKATKYFAKARRERLAYQERKSN